MAEKQVKTTAEKEQKAPKAEVKKATAPKTEPKKAEVKKEAAPKTEPKKVEAKKAAAPKAEVKKEAAPKAEPKKAEAKKETAQKQLKITLIKSTIGSLQKHKRTIQALGLKKIRSYKIHNDNAAIRGMIFVVKHLIKVEEL